MMSEKQLKRYNRQIIINEIGTEGQQKLAESRVLIIGAGGLGSPSAFYLAAAGTGTLGIADSDVVELSNLNRQILHFTSDINKKKTDSAREKLKRLNPVININTYNITVDIKNIADLIGAYDFIIDATDNFDTKFLINDSCVRGKKPFSHAGVSGFRGQTFTYLPGTACYRCLYEAPPSDGEVPEPEQSGVIGFIPGIIGTIQASEAIKYTLGTGDLLTNRVMVLDGLAMKFREIKIEPDIDCPVCSSKNRC